MVQVRPPPGWQPTPPPVQRPLPTESAVPPPLDRVADVPLALELEPTKTSPLGMLLRQKWFIWGIVPLTMGTAILGLSWVLFSRPEPEPAAVEAKKPAPAVAKAVAPQPSRPPVPQSPGNPRREGVEPSASLPGLSASLPGLSSPGVAKHENGVASASAPPSRPPEVKPAEANPFSAVATNSAVAAKPAEKAADGARPPEVKKTPPLQVDVAARLADPIDQLELTNTPLAKAVDLLATMGTLSVTMDADAMMQLGVTPRDPVSLQLHSTTLGKALQAAVAQKGLAMAAENGQVLVRAPAEYRETLRKVRYTVSDLTGEDKAAVAELAALVRKLVAPESWQGNNGRGTIEPDGGALVVVQSGDVHQQVLVFCEKLRLARHKPLRSRDDPQRFALTTPWDRARGMLEQPVTANFHEPAPLAKILAFLSQAAGAEILVDRAALAAAETSDRMEATLNAKQQALGSALAALLQPLGLTYRVVGAAAIQVTTQQAAEERLELEFYPIGPWLAKDISGAHTAERVKASVAASTWSDVGGPAEVCFDPPSQCLIVLQSQPAQTAIQQLLARAPQPAK